MDGDSRLSLPAGDYNLMVDPANDETGPYAYRLVDSASSAPFTPGTAVHGALRPGISTTLYRFTAAAGARFYFDGRPVSGFTSTPWVKLYSPLAEVVLGAHLVSSDHDVFTIPQSGTCLLVVEGRYNDTSTNGQFSFLLQPVIDETNTFAIGQQPGQAPMYEHAIFIGLELMPVLLIYRGWFIISRVGLCKLATGYNE